MQFEGVLIKTNFQEVGQAQMYVQWTSCPIKNSNLPWKSKKV